MSLIDRLFNRPPEPDNEPVDHALQVQNGKHLRALNRAQKAIRSADKILDDYQRAEQGRKP